MYDIPSRTDVKKCVVSGETIRSRKRPLLLTRSGAERGRRGVGRGYRRSEGRLGVGSRSSVASKKKARETAGLFCWPVLQFSEQRCAVRVQGGSGFARRRIGEGRELDRVARHARADRCRGRRPYTIMLRTATCGSASTWATFWIGPQGMLSASSAASQSAVGARTQSGFEFWLQFGVVLASGARSTEARVASQRGRCR